MRHRSSALAVSGLLPLLASGCSSFIEGDCVAIGVYGIQVTALDARTSQPAEGATLRLADGEYQEVRGGAIVPAANGVLYGASERTGTYTVTVTAPGYAPWTETNVVVTRGGRCDYLRRIELTARLERAAATAHAAARAVARHL